VFHFQFGPQFKAAAARLAAPLRPLADKIPRSVAGWGAVIVAGAVLMANASHDSVAAPPAPVAVAAPAPAAAKVEPTQVAVEPEKPAPPPVVAKTTQRVDMTPTAAIPAEPAHKARHRAHRKKAVDISH
jgi:hypothetical protein